jgi:hypothetical protein
VEQEPKVLKEHQQELKVQQDFKVLKEPKVLKEHQQELKVIQEHKVL